MTIKEVLRNIKNNEKQLAIKYPVEKQKKEMERRYNKI